MCDSISAADRESLFFGISVTFFVGVAAYLLALAACVAAVGVKRP